MAIAGILNSVSNAASAASSQISGKDFQAYFKLRQPLIQHLGQALKSGDLAAAKEALDKLTAFATQNGLKNPFLRHDRAADFTAIAAALKSGDVSGAELAFSSLKQDLGKHFPTPQPVPPGVPPDVIVTIGGGGPVAGQDGGPTGVKTPAPTPIAQPPVPTPAPPEVVVSVNDVKGSGSPSEQIVLNLSGGNGAKGGEQINIGISQTSSGEQISLSFGKGGSTGSTPNVQLNLGNTPSEIDIAISQTSAGEQIAFSFKSAAQSAVQALTSGASSQSTSSSLSVSG